MKNKIEERRIRAIIGTDNCLRPKLNIGLFPYQDYYRGLRLFAVYHQHYFLEAFRSLSSAKKFVRDHIDPCYSKDLHIVLFEAK